MPIKHMLIVVIPVIMNGCSTMRCNSPHVGQCKPTHEIAWIGASGFAEWGQTKDGLWATSAGTRLFQAWKWQGATVERMKDIQLPTLLRMTPLSDEHYVACLEPDTKRNWPLSLVSFASEARIKQWQQEKGWRYEKVGASRNGKFVATLLVEGVGELAPEDNDPHNPRMRVGLLDIAGKELKWIVTYRGKISGDIRSITVSDDGKYIAISGWNSDVALVDAQAGKIQWIGGPAEAVSFTKSVFSSDSYTLYAADAADGCVYAFETKTGKVLRKWYATETGDAIYGHRISCSAISPDDAWIAAGTGPEGQVFLFRADSSEGKPIVFAHGLSTILIVSFSPTSQCLASVAGGKVKIWPVPR